MNILKSLRNSPPFNQLMLSLFVILVSSLLITTLGFIAAAFIFDMGIMEIQSSVADISIKHNVSILKFLQAVQSVGIFIVPPVVIAVLLSKRPVNYLQMDRIPNAVSILIVIMAIYCANPLINYLAELNNMLSLPASLSGIEEWMRNAEDFAAKVTDAFLLGDSTGTLLINILIIAFLPAIGEELLFRGVIQNQLYRLIKNSHAAIWISAAIFSALHFQFYGFIPRVLLGAMFGYFLAWGGSLWMPIIAHFINNASAVLASYLFQKGVISRNLDEIGTISEGSAAWAAVSVVLLTALMSWFYKREIITHK